jgi:hypothetical protein
MKLSQKTPNVSYHLGDLSHKLCSFKLLYTGNTQKNGAVSIVNSFETAPFFCVCPVYEMLYEYTNSVKPNYYVLQGCTNPGHWATHTTEFCRVVPIICGSSVWKFLPFTHLAPRILRRFLNFWKICAPLMYPVS